MSSGLPGSAVVCLAAVFSANAVRCAALPRFAFPTAYAEGGAAQQLQQFATVVGVLQPSLQPLQLLLADLPGRIEWNDSQAVLHQGATRVCKTVRRYMHRLEAAGIPRAAARWQRVAKTATAHLQELLVGQEHLRLVRDRVFIPAPINRL